MKLKNIAAAVGGIATGLAALNATAGKPLKFLNTDDSPHFIVVQGGPKTDVLLRGQSASVTFDKAGGYNYICGLHPSMKGTVEVK